jgi:large subunit ribosomal protein L21
VGQPTHRFLLSTESTTRGVVQVYAVVETGGKQYRVKVGDSIKVEYLDAEPGDEVTLDRVLMLSNDGNVKVGRPVVEGAKVVASVDEQGKGDKIRIFKMRAKKRYRKTQGHRQRLTMLTIKDIVDA